MSTDVNHILLIDNYDSFTYNLVELLRQITSKDPVVIKNDQLEINQIANYHKIILSPGPGLPDDAGMLCQVIETYYKSKSILGICLGHQALNIVGGGTLKQLQTVYHGLGTKLHIVQSDPIFEETDLEDIYVGRYHSWAIDELAQEYEVLATDGHDEIMVIRHNKYDLYGLQFHPESILTPYGKGMLTNWLYKNSR